MEWLMRFWFLIAPLFMVLDSAFAQQKIYVEVGGTIVLRPPTSEPTRNILWKYGNSLVAEWLGSEVDYYPAFRGRTTLDTTTGVLKIKNAIANDTEIYTVEINNQVQKERHSVEVIKKVPKPEVAFRPVSCSSTSTDCSLICYGEIKEAGPVTYTWWKGDGEWTQTGKDMLIMNNEEFQSVKTFSCQMKNPVSEEKSEPQENPFFKEPSSANGVGIGVGLFVLFLSLLVLGGVVAFTQKNRILEFVRSRQADIGQPLDESPTGNAQPPNETPVDSPVNNGKPDETKPLNSDITEENLPAIEEA